VSEPDSIDRKNHPLQRQLVLEQDAVTGVLNFSGNVQNLDVILGMLAQATRHVETQFRINAGMAAQEMRASQKKDAELVSQLAQSMR
jgi:hypothetical protein